MHAVSKLDQLYVLKAAHIGFDELFTSCFIYESYIKFFKIRLKVFTQR